MIAQSVADILGRHVRLAVEGIDRMYLNIYVPQLQSERGVVRFFREHRGQPLPSAALMSPMSRDFVAKLERFVAQHEIPLVQFRKGQRKDTVMAEYLGKFHQQEGVVFVGKAQEKTPVPHREAPEPGHRPALSVDRAFHRHSEPLLRLRGGPRLRPVLSEVLHLLSIQCQAVPQRSRIRQATTRPQRHRLRSAR